MDSSDRDRLDEARQELHRIISDREMKESLLLVFANKQDIPGCMPPSRTKLVLAAQLRVATNGALLMHLTAMKPAEVTEKLQLSRLDRIWYVVPSCATTGEGIFEGLVRLTSLITPFVYFSGLHAYYDSLGLGLAIE